MTSFFLSHPHLHTIKFCQLYLQNISGSNHFSPAHHCCPGPGLHHFLDFCRGLLMSVPAPLTPHYFLSLVLHTTVSVILTGSLSVSQVIWLICMGLFSVHYLRSRLYEEGSSSNVLSKKCEKRTSGEKGEQDMEVEEEIRERVWIQAVAHPQLTCQGRARGYTLPERCLYNAGKLDFRPPCHSVICFRPLFLWLLQQAKLLPWSASIWSDVCTQASPHSTPSWRTSLCSDESCH